jgi:probable F420-dependent oxidoreductase
MKFFFYFPGRWVPVNKQLVTGPVYKALAIGAEQAGFYGVAMDEHPAPGGAWLKNHGHHSFDPFVLLAAAAAVTTKIKLLTYLAVLPYRNPFLFTKAATSVDVVSDGRLIVGVGVGYLKAEFEALGVDFDKRNELFDEVISVFREACTGDPTTYEGSNFDAKEVEIIPAAIQRPHPPIWLGGNSHLTRRRVIEYGQGWIPMPLKRSQIGGMHKTPPLENPADMQHYLDEMHEYADKRGRKTPFDVVISSGMLDLDASSENLIAQIKEYEALGVTGVAVNGRGDTPQEAQRFVDNFGDRIIPAFSA